MNKRELIIMCMREHFGVTRTQLMSDSRKANVVKCRNYCMYFLRKKIKSLSLREIAEVFNRAHSSVIHSIRTVEIEADMITEEGFRLLELQDEVDLWLKPGYYSLHRERMKVGKRLKLLTELFGELGSEIDETIEKMENIRKKIEN